MKYPVAPARRGTVDIGVLAEIAHDEDGMWAVRASARSAVSTSSPALLGRRAGRSPVRQRRHEVAEAVERQSGLDDVAGGA